ncbi:MAG: histidine kinase, partial [Flavobacterium sp.]
MKEILENIKANKIHFISWAVFISAEILIIGLATKSFGKPGNYFLHYTINICLFYFCANVLYPRIIKDDLSWLWKLPLSLTIVYGVYLLLNYIIDSAINKHTKWNEIDDMLMDESYVFGLLWRALQFVGFSGFYFLFKQYQAKVEQNKKIQEEVYQNSIQKKNMEIDLNNAKNSYLQAQINPHLLFNTLNFIYQKTLIQAPEIAESVMTLSDIMRYSTN